MKTDLPALCPVCNKPIPADAPDGICPKCVLNSVVESKVPSSVAEPGIDEVQEVFSEFEILELIGLGGIGRVYRTRDPKMDRLVALKILSPDRGEDPEWIERFTREARALARLNHPHIVQVHSFGTDPKPHLVMEFIDGVNLRDALDGGSLSAREALVIVPKLCDALQYAHEHGVLHRDIKPENILVDTEGRVKLVDFGLAKLHDENALAFTLTQTGAKLGTIAYMAPEQIEKPSDVDHRADIYSLGVVFYEMLTGELPLGRFPAPSEAGGSDPRLDSVVLRTLEKKKEKRYPDAGKMRTDIENSQARPAPSSLAPAARQPNTKRNLLVAGVAILVSILVGFIIVAFSTPVIYSLRKKNQLEEANQAQAAAIRETEQTLKEERKEQDLREIKEQSAAWISQASRTDDPSAKQKALDEILAAIESQNYAKLSAGLGAVPYLSPIAFDRTPFQAAIKQYLECEDWTVREKAISAYFMGEYEQEDIDLILTMVDSAPINQLGILAMPLAKDCENDFTKKHAQPMLKLLEKGFEAARSGKYSRRDFGSRNILGTLWGAKVTPEIESVIIEWTRLDENEIGQIDTNSRGYDAFYLALSVFANKSTASVERLLHLARNPDTTNIGGRCLWGMQGSVPEKQDQVLVATSVIELLANRHDDYQWRQGVNLLRSYSTEKHLDALKDLASLPDLPESRKDGLVAVMRTLEP